MKIIDWNNQQQKEAILNECKGNLFEFLVTAELAKSSNLELDFLSNLSSDLKQGLKNYEDILRKYEPELVNSLILFAKKTANELLENDKIKGRNFKEWVLIGKLAGTPNNDIWYETDIIGVTEENTKIFLSLKLSKKNSFTNTKSAGAKSFIEKYFSEFRDSKKFQDEFNSEVDLSFDVMGQKLYGVIDKNWQGRFDKNWTDSFSELPGELDKEQSEIVLSNYYRLSKKLYTILNRFYAEDQSKFRNSLKRLCGFGDDEILQISCFHHSNVFDHVKIMCVDDIFYNQMEIEAMVNEKSSIEIDLGKNILQIRIKPMNKFTTASYKINCSMKEKE